MVLGSEEIRSGTGHDAGRALLCRLYREHTGKELPNILIADRGKPYFADGSMHFSISHTKRHVFCALSDRPVGIDAEESDRKIDLRLADKILSPAEKKQYDAAADKQKALLTFWVLKEAHAKYTGRGIQGYPSNTSFSLSDPRVTVRDGCLLAIIQEY